MSVSLRVRCLCLATTLGWLCGMATGAETRQIVFDSTQRVSETRYSLAELGPDVPEDWSGYEALVVELRAASPQRFNLKIYSGADDKFSRVLLQPYPGAWVRMAIPVTMLGAAPATGFDMASVGNRSRTGYYLGLWGPFVPLKAVKAISFSMEHPIGAPKLEVRSIRLAKESPGDAVLEPLPLVDEFGQWIPGEWPGKVASIEQLKADWQREAGALAPGPFAYCEYGGYRETKARAAGFFRVEEIDGKWWFIDPHGHLFLSVGADVMRREMVTPLQGREQLFRVLPPRELLGERSGGSFFSWNLARRLGPDWRTEWVDFTFRRMAAWGLNTVANWSEPDLWAARRQPYVIPLGRWETKVNYLGLPDVFSEEFSKNADAAARRQCASRKDDPLLLGYFLANEPPFPQKALQTAGMILDGPDTATRRALVEWLAGGDTPERRKQFIDDAFDRYIRVTSEAVRRHDPNHLNLGMRSGGHPTEAELRVSRAFDVYSVNVYDYELSRDRMRQISELTGKPVLIGEFHFGVPERGLAASLVQVRNQAERGVAYRYYVEQAFALPGVIGAHWFQWADQPPTGRSDGENYNIGLVDVTDRPYSDLIQALKATHARLRQVHAGEVEPFAQRAKPN